MQAVGRKIAFILTLIGMSKAEFARAAGISKGYLTNICQDKRPNISKDVKEKMEKVLDMPWEDVIRMSVPSEKGGSVGSLKATGTRIIPRVKLSKLHKSGLMEADHMAIAAHDFQHVPASICTSPVCFMVEVDTFPESSRIRVGDQLIVDPDSPWRDGQLCLILIKTEEKEVLRRPYRAGDRIRIRSDNPDLAEESYAPSEIKVFPVVNRITQDF